MYLLYGLEPVAPWRKSKEALVCVGQIPEQKSNDEWFSSWGM